MPRAHYRELAFCFFLLFCFCFFLLFFQEDKQLKKQSEATHEAIHTFEPPMLVCLFPCFFLSFFLSLLACLLVCLFGLFVCLFVTGCVYVCSLVAYLMPCHTGPELSARRSRRRGATCCTATASGARCRPPARRLPRARKCVTTCCAQK